MPSFSRPTALRAPVGRNYYLRSTKDLKTESYTFAQSGLPAVTIDGFGSQQILQPGTAIAKITSGPDAGKVGVYQGGSDAVEESASVKIDATGGSFTLSFRGGTTAAIAFNATAAAVQQALELLAEVNVNDFVVTGGPGSAGGATPYVITASATGQYNNTNVADFTASGASLTGGAGTATVTETQGSAGTLSGATDGRQLAANLLGVCDTFAPWQLMERDIEVAVAYAGDLKQAWLLEWNASGAQIAMTQNTVNLLRTLPNTTFTFH